LIITQNKIKIMRMLLQLGAKRRKLSHRYDTCESEDTLDDKNVNCNNDANLTPLIMESNSATSNTNEGNDYFTASMEPKGWKDILEKEKKVKRIKMPGNGDCLFYSACYARFKKLDSKIYYPRTKTVEPMHFVLRQAAADWLYIYYEKNRDMWNQKVESMRYTLELWHESRKKDTGNSIVDLVTPEEVDKSKPKVFEKLEDFISDLRLKGTWAGFDESIALQFILKLKFECFIVDETKNIVTFNRQNFREMQTLCAADYPDPANPYYPHYVGSFENDLDWNIMQMMENGNSYHYDIWEKISADEVVAQDVPDSTHRCDDEQNKIDNYDCIDDSMEGMNNEDSENKHVQQGKKQSCMTDFILTPKSKSASNSNENGSENSKKSHSKFIEWRNVKEHTIDLAIELNSTQTKGICYFCKVYPFQRQPALQPLEWANCRGDKIKQHHDNKHFYVFDVYKNLDNDLKLRFLNGDKRLHFAVITLDGKLLKAFNESKSKNKRDIKVTPEHIQELKTTLRLVPTEPIYETHETTLSKTDEKEKDAIDLLQTTLGSYGFTPNEDLSSSTFKFSKKIYNVIFSMLAPEKISPAFQKTLKDSKHPQLFEVKIPNKGEFLLIVGFVGKGMSFKLIGEACKLINKHIATSEITTGYYEVVSYYTRYALIFNLEYVRRRLAECGGFSIAFDAAKHSYSNYICLRARFLQGAEIKDAHIMLIPFNESHTGVNMFNKIVPVLDIICPAWRVKLIGISTDGARNNVGKFAGSVSLIAKECEYPPLRYWCVLHQIDIVLKKSNNCLSNWDTVLTSFVSHLHLQHKLQGTMQKVCPYVSIRWLSVAEVTDWLIEHYTTLHDYYDSFIQVNEDSDSDNVDDIIANFFIESGEQKDQSRRAMKRNSKFPPASWWVQTLAINRVLNQMSIVIKSLQKRNIILSEAEQDLENIIAVLSELCHEISQENVQDLSDSIYIEDYTFSMTKFPTFLQSHKKFTFAISRLKEYEIELETSIDVTTEIEKQKRKHKMKKDLFTDIARMLIHISKGLKHVRANRHPNDKPSDSASSANTLIEVNSPTLFHEFAQLTLHQFSTNVLTPRTQQLMKICDEMDKMQSDDRYPAIPIPKYFPDADAIHDDFVKLESWYKNNTNNVKTIVEEVIKKNKRITFKDSWSHAIAANFPYLRIFAGMLATPYPTTAPVESDFSIMRCEKDEYRTNLSDLSLEAIMQCKFYSYLRKTD